MSLAKLQAWRRLSRARRARRTNFLCFAFPRFAARRAAKP
ncbi:hypothetical protein BURPS305_4982 [Burkholderia pseudomallei 305]|nr:hypothetical protein BURPS305_4982 [Burkholderia pseudomallei 305]EDS86010.1 putative lipoprotein [Burkholderia pseudomallei S13]EDU09647.1 hypothetical protein BURPS1655_K1007 [Burkholderia pseudomallei 1655]